MAEVLRSVLGVFVNSDRACAYPGVRGSAAPGDHNIRILLLIDGNRVNDTVCDQAALGSEFLVDLDLVERVEFVPGQGSAVHGANALFGIVNVITRHAAAAGGGEAAAFVRDLPHNPDDAAIVQAIVSMARSLHLAVVAEGVETEAQRDFLAAQGIRLFQGYLYSRPLAAEVLGALLRRQALGERPWGAEAATDGAPAATALRRAA
jgi:outer membrane receptor for Fe3+-dicitrate